MRSVLLAAACVLLALNAALAQESLQPLAGVKIGKVRYLRSETRRDPALEKAVIRALGLKGVRAAYFYNRVALSGGGPDQAIVEVHGPTVCGSGGCPAFVFTRTARGWRAVSDFTLVHTPIVVLAEKHHGWHSLVWEVSGGGVKAHYAKLDFDGRGYPRNPSSAPVLKPGTVLEGEALMADPVGPEAGLKLQGP
jgi:hypothetical protein